jgi:NAD(P)-dependent dehydrogenase (short-subunit alcohol dehydrogenase family)
MSYTTGDGTGTAALTEPLERPLTGKIVIVSGSGSGIGKATARLAGEAGAHVVCADLRAADETAAAIESAGDSAESHAIDVREAAGWQSLVAGIVKEHGKVDGLCNVAGVVGRGLDNVVDLSEEEWDRVVGTNLKGYWLGMRAVFPSMIENGGGRIVNVSSVAGLIGMINVFAYSAAKGGVIGMTRQAAVEYAGKGIQINAICPGIIETPILGDVTDELRQVCETNTPVGRLGRPEDIGRMMVYLLGPGGDFVTGQVFTVDGGWTAH